MIGVDHDLIRRIGSNIVEARQRAGLTVDEVVHRLKISSELLRGLEAGDIEACSDLDLRTFLRLVRCLETAACVILLND